MIYIGRDRPNSHSDTPVNNCIFNSNIFGTISNFVSLVCWFDSYSIIKVCNCQIFHIEVAAAWIYTIGIKRESWDIELVVILSKSLCKFLLGVNIDIDHNISDIEVLNINKEEMIHG